VDQLLLCFGDRKILDPGPEGFKFDAKFATPANAYWLALLSTAAYFDLVDLEPFIGEVFSASSKDFHFYDSKQLNGLGAESFYVRTEKGWLFTARGTKGIQDWITNFKRNKLKTKFSNPDGDMEDVAVHNGFYDNGSALFDLFAPKYFSEQKDTELVAGSSEAFKFIDTILSGVASEVDLNIDPRAGEILESELKRRQILGLIKSDANLAELRGAANIWAEENALKSRANGTPTLSTADRDLVGDALDTVPSRKKAAAIRVHRYFRFKTFDPIWFTGHSQGGAVSSVLAYHFLKVGVPVNGLITFGAPRSGNEGFAHQVEYLFRSAGTLLGVARFENHDDMIPLVPAIGGPWAHAGKPWYFSKEGALFYPNSSKGVNSDDVLQQFKNMWQPKSERFKISGYLTTDELPVRKNIWTTDVALTQHSISRHYLKLLEGASFGKNTDCIK
jgi:pimeloyl-ACP methyl ester carboxylesterase